MVMRHTIAVAIVVVPFTLVIALSSIPHRVQAQRSGPAAAKPGTFDAVIEQNIALLSMSAAPAHADQRRGGGRYRGVERGRVVVRGGGYYRAPLYRPYY